MKGLRRRTRPWAGVLAGLLAVLLLSATVPRHAQPLGETSPPAVEAVVGQGWGWRALCVGCVAALIYQAAANPLLLVYYTVMNPSLAEGCSLACIVAVA